MSDLVWHGDDFLEFAGKVTKEAMTKAALVVEREAKRSFGKGASSPFTSVKRGKRKRHRPSAPGFAPNVDTGVLKSSVATLIKKAKGKDKGAEGYVGYDIVKVERGLRKQKKKIKNIKTMVEYGLYLEVGTKNMHARPWLRPALRKSGREILKIFKKAMS